MDDSELEAQFTAEMLVLEKSGAGMPFVFKPSEGFMLLAVLQLALRHPEMVKGNTGEFARLLAENIQGRLCKTPAMAEVAERGWYAGEPAAEEQSAAAPPPKTKLPASRRVAGKPRS